MIILLNNLIQVSQEFDRITGLTESMATFTTNWQNYWIKAIQAVSKEEGLLKDKEVNTDGNDI